MFIFTSLLFLAITSALLVGFGEAAIESIYYKIQKVSG
jgi:hypothetical protein